MRIFVAVFPPSEVQAALLQAAQGIPLEGTVRWVRQGNIHFTLKFLGDTDEETLNRVRTTLGEVAGRHGPFDIRPSGLGAFPSKKRGRILWAGVDEGSTGLSALATDIEQSLESIGTKKEKRGYKPHATIGRVRDRPLKLPDDTGIRIPRFTARRLDLVESVLGTGGATYEILNSYNLSDELRQKPSYRE